MSWRGYTAIYRFDVSHKPTIVSYLVLYCMVGNFRNWYIVHSSKLYHPTDTSMHIICKEIVIYMQT